MTQLLIDTNVLLRSVEPEHVQHPTSARAIDQLRRDGHRLVIVPQVLYEFWAVATRPVADNGLEMTTAEAEVEITDIKRLFRLLRDERAIYDGWERLVATLEVKGKRAHDARLVAAMQRHAVAHILTFNQPDFTRYSDIHAWTPREILDGLAAI